MKKTIIIWACVCVALGVFGVWIAEDWKGLGMMFLPLLKFLGLGGDGDLEKLNKESKQDLKDVKRRKKKIREKNNATDLAHALTKSSKRRKRSP